MSYVKKILQPDETLTHVCRLHWVLYFPGVCTLVLAFAALFYALVITDITSKSVGITIFILSLFIGPALLISAWITRTTTEIAVTNKRVIYKTGFISRKTTEMNMSKIESVDVTQGIDGRVFDFGTVVIRGTGIGLAPLQNIDHPIELRNAIVAR